MILRPLPPQAANLCSVAGASPRLVAHLTLVHDVAVQICDWLSRAFPNLAFDRNAVEFGAATHDIGKAFHSNELSAGGHSHEPRGRTWMEATGIEPTLARFAETHGAWRTGADIEFEDLLVILADKVWKGKRLDDIEHRIVTHVSEAAGIPEWEVFQRFDDEMQRIASLADQRLAWQGSFPA